MLRFSKRAICFFLFFCAPTISFADGNNLPDPQKDPEYYANIWLLITKTEASEDRCTCDDGVVLNTDLYENLKDGLFVCVRDANPSKNEIYAKRQEYKDKKIESYVKNSGNLKKISGDNGLKVSDTTFNSQIKYATNWVVRDSKTTGENVLKGEYFGSSKGKSEKRGYKILGRKSDKPDDNSIYLSYFCPEEIRGEIKDTVGLQFVLPFKDGNFLLCYFDPEPYSFLTYYIRYNISKDSYDTLHVNEKAGKEGKFTKRTLPGDYVLLERKMLDISCRSEVYFFYLFDDEGNLVQKINESTTIPSKYLDGNRPVMGNRIKEEDFEGYNFSMCGIWECLYKTSYNGKPAILVYEQFSLYERYIWNGQNFEKQNKK